MKLLKIIALTAAVTSTVATANTYQTVVAIDDLAKTLAWSENTQMQFPRVILDASAVNGSTCHTNSIAGVDNQLCNGDRQGATNAIFDVTGSPNANVAVNLDETVKTQEGISFKAHNTGYAIALNSAGQGTYTVIGVLTLDDRSAVVSDSLTFTYDLEFAAQ